MKKNINRSARYSNWIGAMFIRFGASCCPTWDPTNWFSRRLPTLFGIKSRPAENEKLLRTESEEEVFRKRPKRKVRRRRNSADDTADSHHYQLSTADTTAGASADVPNVHSAAAGHTGQNGQNLVTSGGEDKTISESSSFTSDSQIKPGKGRSRREQAALAAKSRRGGRGGYTAANLRRFAAEKKDKSCDKQSDKSSLTAIKNHSGTSSSNSTNHQPVVLKGT